MKFLKNLDFLKISSFQKMSLWIRWGIFGTYTRTGTAPGGLLRRLRRPQEIASGAEVCDVSRQL